MRIRLIRTLVGPSKEWTIEVERGASQQQRLVSDLIADLRHAGLLLAGDEEEPT